MIYSSVGIHICERLRRSVAVVRVVSISNIVSSILITGVEVSLNDVKMMRLAIAILVLSVMFAGNSLTQRSVYHDPVFQLAPQDPGNRISQGAPRPRHRRRRGA